MIRKYMARFRSFWLQDASFVSLFLMLFFTIFVIPALIESESLGTKTFNFMLLALFFVGIWSAETPRLMYFSIAFFLLHLILKIIRFSDLPVQFKWAEQVVASLNVIVFIIINFKLLLKQGSFTFERVIGAVNVYMLFALLGAFIFELIEIVSGTSISGSIELKNIDNDFALYMYYSLVCLTTVGFGDIIPINHTARMLSVFLSALGILYPAIIIARLVSLFDTPTVRNKRKFHEKD